MAKKLSTTPKGRLVFPRLSGAADTKFNAAGVWSTKQTLSAQDAAPHVEAIDAAMATALGEAKETYAKAKAEYAALKSKAGKKPPKEPEMVDKPYFIDEETGSVTFTFKMTASGVNKKTKEAFTQKPVLFDRHGNVITGDLRIGGGTIARVSYELTRFATALGAGASLRLKAVQIIELKEYGADSAAYGFGEEDGSDLPETSEPTPAEEAGFTDDDAAAATDVPAGSESDDF